VVITYYEVLSHHLPGGTEETMRNFSQEAGLQVKVQTWDLLHTKQEGQPVSHDVLSDGLHAVIRITGVSS
jgi:hypothetical protein